MNRGRQNFFRRIAGRIKVEKYHKQIKEITDLVQNYFSTKKHLDLKQDETKLLGKISFNFEGQPVSIDVYVACSPNFFFEAGFDNSIRASANPKLIVNLESHKYDNYIGDSITPVVTHEFTHYLESLYSPTQQQTFTASEYDDKYLGFYKEFLDNLNNHPKYRLDFGNLTSLKGKSIDQVAKMHVLDFVKTKEFAQLAAKYNVVLDRDTLGKLLKMVQSSYIEDMNFYMNTGGDPFGMDKSQETKRVKDEARKIYYNSNTEIAGHLNQIISELENNFALDTILIDLIRGKKLISKELPALLERSKTFQSIENELSEHNLNIIYKEVGKYLLNRTEKKTHKNFEDKIGFSLSPQEELVYRYLKKLYNDGSPKLSELIKNEAFVSKNMGPLTYMNYYINMVKGLEKLRSELFKLVPSSEAAE